MESAGSRHILILPYPAPGHINPLIQFGKRLASHGLKVSIAITRFLAKSMEAETGAVSVEIISDGYDEGGFYEASSVEAYHDKLETVGFQTVTEVIHSYRTTATPITCLVYDAFLAWALDLAKGLGLLGATFFTQSCAVGAIYYNVQLGKAALLLDSGFVASVGLPPLEESELPSFVTNADYAPGFRVLLLGQFRNLEKADWILCNTFDVTNADYAPGFRVLLLGQFRNLEKADWILCNTFDGFEDEVLNWISRAWGKPMKAIGPTVPSFYLDKRVEGDKDYGLSLWARNSSLCKEWLDTRPPGSVVYVSFGSAVKLDETQTGELARGIRASNQNFLWVVRATEESKLPPHFVEQTADEGLVVQWCNQLQVLAHPAVGCFISHCGWNSTLEALSLGVPLVAVPHWTDQPTNAKYIEDVWGVGLRAKKGPITSADIERCIKEVMVGERRIKIKENVDRWRLMAKEAVDEGGVSDKNIKEFVAAVLTR
ncbi:mogroside IE synthase-like [Aristolochia californica]|uniref:mogroside IE synthase-like n=1 Tax=Aristolochia californica TaxID=171875 RepID=UPI0035DBDF03